METVGESSGQLRASEGKRQAQGKDDRVWTDSDQRIQTHACSAVSSLFARCLCSSTLMATARMARTTAAEEEEEAAGKETKMRGKSTEPSFRSSVASVDF